MKSLILISSCFLSIFIQSEINSDTDKLDFFIGKWEIKNWTGNNTGRSPDIEGTWFLDKDTDDPGNYKGYVQIGSKAFTSEVISYNEKDGVFTRVISVLTGAKITLRTIGWANNKLTWSGEQDDGSNKIGIKEEITKKNDDEFTAVFYELRNSKLVLSQTEILKRIN